MLSVKLWRHHDAHACSLPGMFLGDGQVDSDVMGRSRELADGGARMVSLDQPVDLRRPSATAIRALTLLRELTSLGVVVKWSLVAGASLDIPATLGHLYPPSAITGRPDGDEPLADWRTGFYLGKCVYRHGPGFMQVRDRRSGILERFTIDEPHYLHAIDMLVKGAAESELPKDVVTALTAERLAVGFGSHLWWAPYRIRRWPQPSMVV